MQEIKDGIMKEYREIAKELEKIAGENGYNKDANYEGVRGNIAEASGSLSSCAGRFLSTRP